MLNDGGSGSALVLLEVGWSQQRQANPEEDSTGNDLVLISHFIFIWMFSTHFLDPILQAFTFGIH